MPPALTLSQFEALDGALSGYLYAEAAIAREVTLTTATAEIRAVNRLMDAIADVDGYALAVSLGSYADLAAHAAERVTAFLCAA